MARACRSNSRPKASDSPPAASRQSSRSDCSGMSFSMCPPAGQGSRSRAGDEGGRGEPRSEPRDLGRGLQVAALLLLALDGQEQLLEVPEAEALGPVPFDQLVEDGRAVLLDPC